ncbi:MAG TPA: MFS transporter [candidate division Zixibacteria bacterium]|nr:MFS transporter [candidate division Zixibacteria bacterium]
MPRIPNPFAEWNKDFKLLAVATCGVGIFFGIQLTLFNNFIVDQFGIEPHELGTLEALREIPGLLNVLMVALLIRRSLPVMGCVMLVIMGLGLMTYGGVTNVFTLAVVSFFWSIGFHGWIPLGQSMALRFSPPGNKGKWLGQLRSVESIAWLTAIGACLLTLETLRYQGLFFLAGATTVLGGLALLWATRQTGLKEEKGFVFKRRYSVYYALNFLQGFRKQMFITFAIFALVKVHGMPVETTMILMLINQVLVALTGPLMGRMVDNWGERRMLSASYIGLALVFFGYAVIQDRATLYVLFCIDNLIFFGGIALTTYIYKITPEKDLKPTLSMGVTMNHIAAVIAPLVGGVAWYYLGYQVIFFSGSALAIISLIVSQKVDPEGMLAREIAVSRKKEVAV